jgi:hypothetical protein
MKNILLSIVCLLLFACSNDDCCKCGTNNQNYTNLPVGIWEYYDIDGNYYVYRVFDANRTGEYYRTGNYPRHEIFRWDADTVNNVLCIEYDEEVRGRCNIYAISNNILVFDGSSFKKIDKLPDNVERE